MKNIILVSKCLRVTKQDQQEELTFHFKGVCGGEVIKKVVLSKLPAITIKKGEEYLLYVRLSSCEEGVLRGRIMKARLLDECWDKS